MTQAQAKFAAKPVCPKIVLTDGHNDRHQMHSQLLTMASRDLHLHDFRVYRFNVWINGSLQGWPMYASLQSASTHAHAMCRSALRLGKIPKSLTYRVRNKLMGSVAGTSSLSLDIGLNWTQRDDCTLLLISRHKRPTKTQLNYITQKRCKPMVKGAWRRKLQQRDFSSSCALGNVKQPHFRISEAGTRHWKLFDDFFCFVICFRSRFASRGRMKGPIADAVR